MSQLSGKGALVTGASRGIGRAVAERFAEAGARVVVHYGESREEAESLASRIGAVAIQADMGNPAAVRGLIAEADEKLGGLDILVNNAGIAIFKPVGEITEEEYDRMFAVNTKGVFIAMQEAAHRMRDGGRIINVSTGATVTGTANGAIYCGSKAAIEQFSRVLARELGFRGITVNTVSPGFTETDMLKQFPYLCEIGPGMSPFGRLGTGADVAAVIAFLASDDAHWLTGQNVQAGGGVNMV